MPGTTRDVIEEWITIQGVPICLVDTAGIRSTDDTVEQIGVRRAKEYMDRADIILVVVDQSRPLQEEDRQILETARGRQALIVLNKEDLQPAFATEELQSYGLPLLSISASTGAGMGELKDAMLSLALKQVDGGPERPAGQYAPYRGWSGRAVKPCSGPWTRSKRACPSTAPSSISAKPGSSWALLRAIRFTTTL